MAIPIAIGATDITVNLRVLDSTTFLPLTTVTYASAGLDLWYRKGALGAETAITEVTQTITGAHTDGGFVHVSDGVCRLDLPDAAAPTAEHEIVEVGGTVTGGIVMGVALVGRVVPLAPTTAGRTLDVSAGGAITVGSIAANAITAASLAADAATKIAAAIWDRLTSALTTVGSIGEWVLAKLDATVSSRMASGGAVTYTGPVLTSGAVELVAGDDYFDANGRALSWTYTDATNTYTGATGVLKLKKAGSGSVAQSFTLTSIAKVSSTVTVKQELTAAQTTALGAAADSYDGVITITLDPSGTPRVLTPISVPVTVTVT